MDVDLPDNKRLYEEAFQHLEDATATQPLKLDDTDTHVLHKILLDNLSPMDIYMLYEAYRGARKREYHGLEALKFFHKLNKLPPTEMRMMQGGVVAPFRSISFWEKATLRKFGTPPEPAVYDTARKQRWWFCAHLISTIDNWEHMGYFRNMTTKSIGIFVTHAIYDIANNQCIRLHISRKNRRFDYLQTLNTPVNPQRIGHVQLLHAFNTVAAKLTEWSQRPPHFSAEHTVFRAEFPNVNGEPEADYDARIATLEKRTFYELLAQGLVFKFSKYASANRFKSNPESRKVLTIYAPICSNCNTAAADRVCGACRISSYCSEQCATQHWADGKHHAECKQ